MTYWIDELNNPSSVERRRARVVLVEMGRDAVPGLVAALSDPHVQVRQEVVKALEAIGGEAAARGLVGALEDQDVGIRWLAAEALGNLGVAGLKPVLEALVHDNGLSWLREGAQHVLHFYKGELSKPLEQLLSALDNSTITEALTWEAGMALQSLDTMRDPARAETLHAWR